MFEHELEIALQAADLASQYLLAEYERFEVIPDAPASISTEADRGSQEIILRHVQKHFPGDGLCAEETTATAQAASATGARLWIVDPIDGTRGFARKNGEFSIMIGFVQDGVVGVGVVAQPAVGRCTYARLGAGCWRRDDKKTPQACQVRPIHDLRQSTLTQSRQRDPGKGSRWVQALGPAQVVESYSAGIKLALVARGEADVYLNTYEGFKDWDVCAGQLLVTEAGGRVTDVAGQELRYGLPGAMQANGLLASNGLLHAAALAVIRGTR